MADTTPSCSSSAHSTMNATVSDTKPLPHHVAHQHKRSTQKKQNKKNAPTSLLPCASHIARAHRSANIRTRASSERVCINTSKLSRLSSPSSVAVSASATSAASSASSPVGCAMRGTRTGRICCRRSSRQNAVFFWFSVRWCWVWAVRTAFVYGHALGERLDD